MSLKDPTARAKCLRLTSQHAKSFYFCSLFLEKEKRFSAYSVYAFSRMIDDSFDRCLNAGPDTVVYWQEILSSIYGCSGLSEPVFSAVRETIRKYDIPKNYFEELIRGMEMDIEKTAYVDFSSLYEYCYRVAGVIGLIMLQIFGPSHKNANVQAESMGVAMQLTNILRDIKEDREMGRVYLPSDELQRFGITDEMIKFGTAGDNFKQFMKFQIRRTRSFYRRGFTGLNLIDDKNSRFIAGLMGSMYAGILDSIEKNDYDVFTKRASVRFPLKILITLRFLLKKELIAYES